MEINTLRCKTRIDTLITKEQIDNDIITETYTHWQQ